MEIRKQNPGFQSHKSPKMRVKWTRTVPGAGGAWDISRLPNTFALPGYGMESLISTALPAGAAPGRTYSSQISHASPLLNQAPEVAPPKHFDMLWHSYLTGKAWRHLVRPFGMLCCHTPLCPHPDMNCTSCNRITSG